MNEIVLHESSPQDDSRQYFHIDEIENSSRVKSYDLSGVCPEGFIESIVASPGAIESSEMQDTPAVLSSWHKSLSSGKVEAIFYGFEKYFHRICIQQNANFRLKLHSIFKWQQIFA